MSATFGKDFLEACEGKQVRVVLMGSKKSRGELEEFARAKLGEGDVEGKLVGYGDWGLVLERDEKTTFVGWHAVAMVEMVG